MRNRSNGEYECAWSRNREQEREVRMIGKRESFSVSDEEMEE